LIRIPAILLLTILLLTASGCRTTQSVEEDFDGLTDAEKCRLLELQADSIIDAGDALEARDVLLQAALLLQPGDPDRIRLARRASEVSAAPSLTTARLLLEAPDSLTAFTAIRLGGAQVAPDLVPGLARGDFPLPEYVSLAMAESLLASGDASGALDFLRYVPDSLPGRAGRDRLVTLYTALLAAGRTGGADSLFSQASALGDDEIMSELFHARGMAGIRTEGYIDDLVESFRLWPAGDMHAGAFRAIRYFVLQDSTLASEVADPFYEGGLWNELYDIALDADDPPPHLYYLAARTRDRLGFYDEAVRMLGHYLETWPRGSDAAGATIYLGRDLASAGRVDEGVEKLLEFEAGYPQDPRQGNLPWYIGSLLAENGRWDDALPWLERSFRQNPGNVTADDAHFYFCMGLMKLGSIREAADEFGHFNETWTASVYRPASRYWRGRLFIELGRVEEGRGVLERLIADEPEGLPAAFARECLGLPPWQPVATDEPLAEWMTRYDRPPADPPESALRGLLLLRAGHRDWALGEFRAAEEEVGGVYRLGPFYLGNGVWEREPSAAWRMWSLSPDSERPLELWMLRYPAAWPGLIIDTAGRYGLDPWLAWGIMKQESAFQPGCYSTAGARGLIQMIPSTSEYVALEHGWDGYSPDILYDPAVSIEYGLCYISEVDAGFDHVFCTLAGYNGGPHNALRWGAGEASPEEFFSRITYNETRKYTEIVHHNYVVYRYLYPDLTRITPEGTCR
jgi:tetratricopeptide (TPR) repeat protein